MSGRRRKYAGAPRGQRGAALIILFLAVTVLSVLFVSLVARSVNEHRAVQRQRDAAQALYLAEAGIDQVKKDLFDLFQAYYTAQGQTTAAFSWFDDLPADPNGKYPARPVNAALPGTGGTVTVQITAVDTATSVPKDVTVAATAQVNDTVKRITAVLRYNMAPSKVFDYCYFINNYGWFWGGGITAQGDSRSNGDFNFSGNPKVNGDVYGSINPEIGATGAITGNSKNDTLTYYRGHADPQARPTNPAADPQDIDGDGILETFAYEGGYGGNSQRFPAQQLLDMPYLGDLTYYKNLAGSYNGTIRQNGAPLITNVHNGSIVLIGTDAAPLEISGPVVVSGDVLIKGKVTGQGTIYSGRNTHILGNLEYVNPPEWVKPDTDPAATDAVNNSRDFLGLASKGNVIIGDYTRNDWKTNVVPYIKPNFTRPYSVDPTDTSIGYVQYMSNGTPFFNGDYAAFDGGTKADGTPRRYYESSYADAYVTTVAVSATQINRIDAVTYTNHLFAGKVANFTLNGTIVARDDATVYTGSIEMNYDMRARYRGGMDFFLPRGLALPHVQYVKKE
ncbi:MAG: hypothetical protein NC924_05400 [Candidatus Omnitrophica bacterium]|nr:hypothetical protein [Candidatus Omnitrophota bacterium]